MKHISKLIMLLATLGLLIGCGSDKDTPKEKPKPQLSLVERLLEQVTTGKYKNHEYARTTRLLLEGKLYPGDSPLKIVITSHDVEGGLALGCAINNGKITFVINAYNGKVDLNDSNLNHIIIKSIGV